MSEWIARDSAEIPKDDPRGIVVDLTENGRDVRIVYWSPGRRGGTWHDGALGNTYQEAQFKRFLLLPN